MTEKYIKELGPLAALSGIWEGSKGKDVAPDDGRGTEKNDYRERIEFIPMDPVNNHEQKLWALRYKTTAWRLNEQLPFHEELGYWLWDAEDKQVIRCFMIPRGVTVLAGGTVESDAKKFSIAAVSGSDTYGICSNPFLVREFKTMRYDLKITINGENSFTYEEDTQIQIKGHKSIFHHTDGNTLTRAK